MGEEEAGCGAAQQTHFVSEGLFSTKQTSQLQPGGVLIKSPNPVEGGREEEEEVVVVVEEEEGKAVDGVEVCCRASSGFGEVRATGEAKPGALRRSSTLPCFRVLAGLKGPSKSTVPLLAAGLAAAIVVDSLPLDREGPTFATGALKVNPAEGENDGGLEAVALTIGEENVKGTHGGVEAVCGSLFVSLGGVTGVTLMALLMVVDVVGGGSGEVKLKVGRAEVLIGSEIVGRSGTSATSSSSGRLVEGRAVVRSLFILPPPEPTLVEEGVLDRG